MSEMAQGRTTCTPSPRGINRTGRIQRGMCARSDGRLSGASDVLIACFRLVLMAEETNIVFAKDDAIIVEEALASVAEKLAAGGFVRFERAGEVVMVNAAAVRYLRTPRRSSPYTRPSHPLRSLIFQEDIRQIGCAHSTAPRR